MGTTFENNATPEPEGIEQLLKRQQRELKEAQARVTQENREAAKAVRDAVRTDAGQALAESLKAIDQQLAKGRQTDNLVTLPVYGGPGADLTVPLKRAQDAAGPGERAVVVCVPRPTSTGKQEQKAWLIADVSDVVWN